MYNISVFYFSDVQITIRIDIYENRKTPYSQLNTEFFYDSISLKISTKTKAYLLPTVYNSGSKLALYLKMIAVGQTILRGRTAKFSLE